MRKKIEFEILSGNTIQGYAINPGKYSPEALQNEMNRILEEAGESVRFIWNPKTKAYHFTPAPKGTLTLRTKLHEVGHNDRPQ